MPAFWTSFSQKLKGWFGKGEALSFELLEEALIESDISVALAQKWVQDLAKRSWSKEVTLEDVQNVLIQDVVKSLSPHVRSLDFSKNPRTVLFVGVNGSGKTTTIAKLGHFWKRQNLKVAFVAGDTFRAAAVEQLNLWGERLNIPVFSKPTNHDPAALIYEALEKSQKIDRLLIDTAGRLQTNSNLMQELEKILRVIRKIDTQGPDEVFLVVDGTVGQNLLSQVDLFHKSVGLSGLILTKMDGTAKGGSLVQAVDLYKIPVIAVTHGENVEALCAFDAEAFAQKWVKGSIS